MNVFLLWRVCSIGLTVERTVCVTARMRSSSHFEFLSGTDQNILFPPNTCQLQCVEGSGTVW